MLKQVKDEKEFNIEFKKNKDLIVVFTTTTCPSCISLKPILKKFESKYSKLNIIKVELDEEENEELGDKYQIMAVPSIVVFKDQKEIKRMVGFQSLSELKKELINNEK